MINTLSTLFVCQKCLFDVGVRWFTLEKRMLEEGTEIQSWIGFFCILMFWCRNRSWIQHKFAFTSLCVDISFFCFWKHWRGKEDGYNCRLVWKGMEDWIPAIIHLTCFWCFYRRCLDLLRLFKCIDTKEGFVVQNHIWQM